MLNIDKMNESNPNITSAGQEGVAGSDCENKPLLVDTAQSKLCDNLLTSESDNRKKNKLVGSASKIARPTGIKLPGLGPESGEGLTSSRIARLCNNAVKPAIPSNTCPATNTKEGDENRIPDLGVEKCFRERKMSGDSSRRSTPEDLRKLRTADVSHCLNSFDDYRNSDDNNEGHRSLDAGAVLTENTDQFIIGDRVWVGGVKPGQIAYIGETQFAPGDWAGVVLDEPIGKNDGTVANIRYFQCDPKRGIFSRLTRLTKYPLADGGAGEPAATRSMSPETKRTNGSLSSFVLKKSPPASSAPTSTLKNAVSKPSSPDSGVHAGSSSLSVGDRVIIKSSQGSKAGILRYIGTTEFAAGDWCGVELDDPLGKNDGSVAGTRYFECQPKFGLFAPLHKVSKSPANKRLFQPCMVHPGRTSIRRQNSKESLVSMSSAASTTTSVRSTSRKAGMKTPAPNSVTTRTTTLQETLKKKELHIEQLLKERNLDRAEVTRAASQADEAERQLAVTKKEYETYRKEVDRRLLELDTLVSKLKTEKIELASQLDDEKKKNEDLLFRFEEETIDKADIRSTIAQYEEKLNQLQKTLTDERKRFETLEQDSNKLFEAEEQMVIIKDELDTVREEFEVQKKIRTALEQEHISLEAHLAAARAEIESLKIENQSLRSTASNDENILKKKLTTAIRELEECKRELESEREKGERLRKEVEKMDRELIDRNRETDERCRAIVLEQSEKHKADLKKITEETNFNWETKMAVLEEKLREKIEESKALGEKLNEANVFRSKNEAIKAAESVKRQEEEAKFQRELKDLEKELMKRDVALSEETAKSEKFMEEIEALKSKLSEVENKFSLASLSSDKQVEFLNETIRRQKFELENTKNELENCASELRISRESEKALKEELEGKSIKTNVALEEKDSEIKKWKDVVERTREECRLKGEENERALRSQEETLNSKIKFFEDMNADIKLELDRLNRELKASKNSLEVRESDLKSEQLNSRNLAEKLLALEENFRKTTEEKDQIELEMGDLRRQVQSAEDKLNQMTRQKEKLESDISSFINSSNDSSQQMTKLNDDLRAKEKEIDLLREEISEKTARFERTEQELRQQMEKQDQLLKSLKDERETDDNNQRNELNSLRNKIEASEAAFKSSEGEWMKKIEEESSKAKKRIRELEEKVKFWEASSVEAKNQHEIYVRELLETQKELEKNLKDAEAEKADAINSMEAKIRTLNVECTNWLETVEKMKVEFSSCERQLAENANRDSEISAGEIENLKRKLNGVESVLTQTLEELSREKGEKNRLSSENSDLEKAVKKAEALVNSTEEKCSELTVVVSSVEGENRILKETVAQLREEKCLLEKEVAQKEMLLADLKSQVKSLESRRKTSEEETEAEIRNLQEEISRLRKSLKKTEVTSSASALENSKKIETLEREIRKFKEDSSQVLSRKEKDVENVNMIAERMKKNLEESKSECNRKAEKIGDLEKCVRRLNEELVGEKKKSQELERKYAAAEKRIEEAKQESERQSDTSKMALRQKETEMRSLVEELEALKSEKTKFREKEKSSENKNTPAKEGSKTIEVSGEPDFERGQIDFLNSVIVDMQKKNDALKARIEILEMGYSPEDVEEFNLHNINAAQSVAPRLFCDICDRFDVHDTEDCPAQAGESEDLPPPRPPKSSKSKVPPPERPYCEVCEVFGHDTTNCDDAETF